MVSALGTVNEHYLMDGCNANQTLIKLWFGKTKLKHKFT